MEVNTIAHFNSAAFLNLCKFNIIWVNKIVATEIYFVADEIESDRFPNPLVGPSPAALPCPPLFLIHWSDLYTFLSTFHAGAQCRIIGEGPGANYHVARCGIVGTLYQAL